MERPGANGTNPSVASGRPLHRWVYAQINASLLHDHLEQGSRLPSERELSEQYGVSRVTIRKALEALETDGVVRSAKGVGWLVSVTTPGETQNDVMSFTDMAAARGLTATSRVVVQRERPATLDEADTLRVAPGAPLVELERVRLLDDLPVVIDWSAVPASRFPGLLDHDFRTASLYRLLAEEYGCVPTTASYTMQAVAADERQAALLDLEPGAPILASSQVANDQTGRPFQICLFSYRGDRYRMQVRLGPKR